ncbi:hypothetical protein BBK36DRAFT_1117440 [Trichoderma citrinoviride]|uniref:Uncharacterized protein n=1 Tax=Trichoderma citrinoviride TaxID=58853 RepID=A0A2T4BCK0_9HYPO|nr:hypothetical protein BBK36DRAFT_1117440 [Trichoderma citrinoviride]PTB67047.1 hypothetical protein BBK36DRAFT_1117440 [Trichoderma citrinoviride]
MTGGTPPVLPGPGVQGAAPSPTNGVPERGGSAPVAQGGGGGGGDAKAGGNDDKARAYRALLDLVQKTDASVVRQVVREHWGKCLAGSDYHSSFIANAAINYSNPGVISRTMQDLGEKVIKASKRELAKHFTGQDLDEIADLIGPKLSTHFQDRVMATRLETIGAQDLINALARAERLGYHINDIVKKKPGTGGESVIPSINTLITSLPPQMPPHQMHGGAPPPPMPPHPGQGPPQQPHHPAYPPHPPQQYGVPQTHQHPNPMPMNGAAVPHRPPASSQPPPQAATPRGRPGPAARIVYCSTCQRPCSSQEALNYHHKRAKCHMPKQAENSNADTCIHCGSLFESSGGLAYHLKSDVCGVHTEATRLQMVEMLKPWERMRQQTASQPPSTYVAPPSYQTTPSQPAGATTPAAKAFTTPSHNAATPVATPSPSGNDPYAKLTPDQRRAFDLEMKQVDDYYLGQMRDAQARLPAGPREEELAKLKNRYNTKQSMTRKKYGIRLRGRRADTDADRSWNGGSGDSGQAAKKARTDDGQARPTQAASQVVESPRRRVPLAEMGGLGASSATAELVDPTTSSANSQPPPPTPAQNQPTTRPPPSIQVAIPAPTHHGTHDDPMQIDDNESTDSDNMDIPARIKTT